MDNKYFTPELEDLRIGYECQVFNNATGDWQDLTLTKDNIVGVLHKLVHLNREYAEKHIRTSYITKEQLEAKGWNEAWKDNENKLLFGMNAWTLTKSIDHLTYEISSIPDLDETEPQVAHTFRCTNNDVEPKNEFYIFSGPIPSINEFNLICKMADIK